ncbi:BgTH12-07455 [Blumeria graminis f. sp. triticale]|nr:BgTH12-07455 [Blumeria graminis f. sp. triticale]
MYLLHE